MAKHLIDLGEGLVNELKRLDAQIIAKAQELALLNDNVKALQVYKRYILQDFTAKNDLQGQFNLTENYQLEVVEEVQESKPAEEPAEEPVEA